MRERIVKVGAGVAVLAALTGGGIAWATADDDGDQSVTGPAADRARAAALGYLGSGQATAVERDSEGGAVWEVEVRRPDGSTVDVRLDAGYRVLGVDGDSEKSDDADD